MKGEYMKKLFHKFRRSAFIKNVAIMAIGTAGAQIISVALSPVITRLYGPEAFGIMGTFTALHRIVIPYDALTYPIAIVLPKNDKKAKCLIKLSVFITTIITSIAILFLPAFHYKIVEVFYIGGNPA